MRDCPKAETRADAARSSFLIPHSAFPTVYKLGGSLFDLPDLKGRLSRVLAGEPRALVVCGGGAAADAVRAWDRVHGLGEDAAHRVACEALGVSARFVSELIGGELVATRDAAGDAWARGRVCVLDLPRWVEREAPRDPAAPPRTWETTSDTLAAWAARRWPAGRLVLLKSCGERPGAVDRHFAASAAGLRVDWVNLRGEGFGEASEGASAPRASRAVPPASRRTGG